MFPDFLPTYSGWFRPLVPRRLRHDCEHKLLINSDPPLDYIFPFHNFPHDRHAQHVALYFGRVLWKRSVFEKEHLQLWVVQSYFQHWKLHTQIIVEVKFFFLVNLICCLESESIFLLLRKLLFPNLKFQMS
jgi:hypothetical protein